MLSDLVSELQALESDSLWLKHSSFDRRLDSSVLGTQILQERSQKPRIRLVPLEVSTSHINVSRWEPDVRRSRLPALTLRTGHVVEAFAEIARSARCDFSDFFRGFHSESYKLSIFCLAIELISLIELSVSNCSGLSMSSSDF